MATAAEDKRRSAWADFFVNLATKKPLGLIGAIIVVVALLVGIFAGVLAPFGENEIDLRNRLAPPSLEHLLGTDNLGRDLLSRLVYGARISMTIGLAGTAVAVLVALLIGMAAGYFGGKADLIIQRFVDAWMAFPSLLILITVMSLLGRGAAQIIFALGISWGISSSRIVRGAILGIKENAYFQAARAVGAPATRTLIRHVLPNIAAPLIVIYTTTIGGMLRGVMLTEAALGFLGFGLPPDVASWGGMLSFEGRQYMQLAPRLAIWPGVALTTVVFGINVLGDALRDLLDPRLRGGSGRFSGTKAQKALKQVVAPRQAQPGASPLSVRRRVPPRAANVAPPSARRHRWTALSPSSALWATSDRTLSRTSCQAGYAEGGAKN